jgi:hypothetical protein
MATRRRQTTRNDELRQALLVIAALVGLALAARLPGL